MSIRRTEANEFRVTYGLASETNTFLRVQNRALSNVSWIYPIGWSCSVVAYLPDQALHATSTTIGLVESNLTKDLAAMFPIYIEPRD